MDALESLMGTLAGFVSAHPWWTIALIVVGWVLSNAVASLPSPNSVPGPISSPMYKWFFATVTGIFGALPRLFPWLRLPSDPTRKSPTFFGSGASNPPEEKQQ